MATLKARLSAALQAYADGSGQELLRESLGTPGQKIRLSTGEVVTTGKAWAGPGFLNGLTGTLQTVFGDVAVAWADISTGPVAGASTVNGGQRVASASKIDANTLAVAFSPAFASAVYAVSALIVSPFLGVSTVEVVSRTASELRWRWADGLGAPIAVADRVVCVVVTGEGEN